jgi:hypothetical protein
MVITSAQFLAYMLIAAPHTDAYPPSDSDLTDFFQSLGDLKSVEDTTAAFHFFFKELFSAMADKLEELFRQFPEIWAPKSSALPGLWRQFLVETERNQFFGKVIKNRAV